jgi:hypothetical protein
MFSALADIESPNQPTGPAQPDQSFRIGNRKESHIYERAEMVAELRHGYRNYLSFQPPMIRIFSRIAKEEVTRKEFHRE